MTKPAFARLPWPRILVGKINRERYFFEHVEELEARPGSGQPLSFPHAAPTPWASAKVRRARCRLHRHSRPPVYRPRLNQAASDSLQSHLVLSDQSEVVVGQVEMLIENRDEHLVTALIAVIVVEELAVLRVVDDVVVAYRGRSCR